MRDKEITRAHPACTLRNQRGMSMIEAMVALGLLVTTAAMMGDFLVGQTRQASSNYLDTVAYGLAADTLESARAVSYENIVEGTTTAAVGGVTFTTTTQVQNDTPVEGVKTITAQVSWNEPSGPRSISVPTIYTRISPFGSSGAS
jgi:type II secretory pathway pseudopilin PulG